MKLGLSFLFFCLFFLNASAQCLIDSVCINAILADPNSATENFDTDQNGIAEDLDEYVEICNKSISDVDLMGWILQDDDGNTAYKFISSTILPADSCFMFVSNWQNNTMSPPSGVFDLDLSVPWINNDGDLISIIKNQVEFCQVAFGNQDCVGIINPTIMVCDDWEDPVDGCPLVLGSTVCTFYPTSLPVEMLYFEAIASGRQVQVNWATSIEINNDYFEVQWSGDGKSFISLSTIEGKGNNYGIQRYGYLDRRAVSSANYYRLKQVDLNGRFEYSNVAMTIVNQINHLNVYSLNGTKNIMVKTRDLMEFSIEVYNVSGKKMASHNQLIGSQKLDFSHLDNGIYIVNYLSQNEDKSFKIIIE